jgi:1-deoxy-D-xylulose-5-phosphate reductoisomerase
MKNIVILGSTGSIGLQALDVVRQHPDKLRVIGLAANTSMKLLFSQAKEFNVENIALACEEKLPQMYDIPSTSRLTRGSAAVVELAAGTDADIVLNAMVGAAGVNASYATLASGKTLALANKESLVVAGDLLCAMASPGQLLPVDSEHSAIFQCLLGEEAADLSCLWLTASGGPFRGYSRLQLQNVSLAQTLAHPTWQMGAKITVDSATMMNKGLELIEAHHLFKLGYDKIKIVVHPQSCVHSMVAYRDGSVKAHLGVTDMRIPIQFAFSYPKRWLSPLPELDFAQLGSLTFEQVDTEVFGCLAHAIEAAKCGGTMPAALNAANEVAVRAFLNENITFLDIERVVGAVMGYHDAQRCESLEQLEEVDNWARARASEEVQCLR